MLGCRVDEAVPMLLEQNSHIVLYIILQMDTLGQTSTTRVERTEIHTIHSKPLFFQKNGVQGRYRNDARNARPKHTAKAFHNNRAGTEVLN